jgi:hypothetical protein
MSDDTSDILVGLGIFALAAYSSFRALVWAAGGQAAAEKSYNLKEGSLELERRMTKLALGEDVLTRGLIKT